MTDWYKMDPIAWNDGTQDLTLEQEAAYLRICNAIYISERPIRDNAFVIAGLFRCNERKAKRLLLELVAAGKITIEDGVISNRRAIEEVSNRDRIRMERQSAGSRGGVESGKARAKPLKDNDTGEANASSKNEPDKTRGEEKREKPRASGMIYDKLIEAASSRGNCHPNLVMGIQPIVDLLAQNYDIDRDVLPVVREKASPEISSWAYFVKVVVSRVAARSAIPAKPTSAEDWAGRLHVWREDRTWAPAWGPTPDEPGCRAPADLARTAA
jgi:uncharacterized protein YdaU (DUF1376 family)